MPYPNATVHYCITAINPQFLHKTRFTGLDDQAQAIEKFTASGGEPCRDVLRPAMPGEALLLASYCPFSLKGPFREYGPVFVLAQPQADRIQPNNLAELVTCGYLGNTFVLRAYSATERIVDGVVVDHTLAEITLQAMLQRADVRFVLVRFAGYGCYACRIERN